MVPRLARLPYQRTELPLVLLWPVAFAWCPYGTHV